MQPIRQYRTARSLTRAQLASRLGVSVRTVLLWEEKGTMPSASNLHKLAREFSMDLVDLADEVLHWQKVQRWAPPTR